MQIKSGDCFLKRETSPDFYKRTKYQKSISGSYSPGIKPQLLHNVTPVLKIAISRKPCISLFTGDPLATSIR